MDTAQLEEKVYSKLVEDAELTGLLYKNSESVFYLQAPTQYPDYPILVYSTISDVPILHGDNVETMHEVIIRIHIVNGTPAIYEKVRLIMQDLNFTRIQSTQLIEDGRLIQTVDFKIITEV